jgi:hypothetical protein
MAKWVARKVNDYREKRKHEVVFYTYPKLLFCWPVILMGFLLWMFDRWQWADPETLAWIWGITLIVVIITMGIDINRNLTIFWLVVIGGFWILILWLRDVKSVRLFSNIYHFLVDLDPAYSKSLGLIVSIVLLILFFIMWVGTRVNSKWRITHNEFEHYQFGRMDDSLARGAKRVRTSYPDFFELLLCLAGDLIIFDSTGRKELRRIPHVPLLPFVRKRINRLLETTAITAGEIEDEMDAGEDGEDSDRSI